MDERGNERTQLYLLDAEPGAEPEPLVVDPRFMHAAPHVGRDGALLAYATNRRNGRDFDVVARTLPDGEERSFEPGGWCEVGSISPDGRWIAVGRVADRAGDNDLYLWEIDTGEAVHASPHDEEAEWFEPVWLRRLLRIPRRDERGPRHVRDPPVRPRVAKLGDGRRVALGSRVRRRRRGEEPARARERGRLLAARAARSSRRSSCARRCRCPAAASSRNRSSRRTARCSRSGSRVPTEPYDVYLYDLDAHALTRLT